MSSRDDVLQRIRTALADLPPPEEPPPIDVWPRENPPKEQLAERFIRELEAVGGEAHRCESMEQARTKLTEVLDDAERETLGMMDRPLCRELTAQLAPPPLDWGIPDGEPNIMAELSAGLVEADCLLADTGSCMIACGTPHERLLCYLPPICVVIARAEGLREHLPAAWDEVARRTADPEVRGEFVFITGPSRTADIEKILILGVHGPKRLVVLLVG